MSTLGEAVDYIRSKNAGPFWLTLDVFCGSPERYDHVTALLDNVAVADLLKTPLTDLRRFDIPSLRVIKLSIPRPSIQGTRADRDMHGAAWAVLLSGLKLSQGPDGPEAKK